jgi:hypothetical protein
MTPTLPMIVPQPITNQRNGNPSGQKAPLQPKEVWAIRIRLQLAGHVTERRPLTSPHERLIKTDASFVRDGRYAEGSQHPRTPPKNMLGEPCPVTVSLPRKSEIGNSG